MRVLKVLGGVLFGAIAAVVVMALMGSPFSGGIPLVIPSTDAPGEQPDEVFRPVHLAAEAPAAPTAADDGENPVPTVDGTVKVFGGALRATGFGLAPPEIVNPVQAREMAAGAAQLDALRKLAAHLTGSRLEALRSACNYRQQHYTVTESVRAVLRGARVVASRERAGGVEVDMEIELTPEDAPESPEPSPSGEKTL